MSQIRPKSLLESLIYKPQVLKFGTSGRRGEVVHLTQLEIYINALAELQYLQTLPEADGGIRKGDPFYFACDRRPSSQMFVTDQEGRGEIAQAIVQAICDAGMVPVNLGLIPTPGLTCYALSRRQGSIMVTGSHIPFDRNGYKTNTAVGELLKMHEHPIALQVEQVRQAVYQQEFSRSLFNERGMFKGGHRELPPVQAEGQQTYLNRYLDFFHGNTLYGMRLMVFQHSAVGRDLIVELLERLGAETIPVGRSETFIPIDTENVDDTLLAEIQRMTDVAIKSHGAVDAVVSIDGDSDRPMVLGVDQETNRVRFFGGDLLGMIVAEYLCADAVVIPISCNDAVDRGGLKDRLEPKTKIGSPYVIAGMLEALKKGRKSVCGWEANGGFLTGSDIAPAGRILKSLPTRDAFLPILAALLAAKKQGVCVCELFGRLPKRYSKAALLRQFPRAISLRILARFSPGDGRIQSVDYRNGSMEYTDGTLGYYTSNIELHRELLGIKERLLPFFPADQGFGSLEKVDYTDGIRLYFSNGDVAHVRPSGNADELRIYVVADSAERASQIAGDAVQEPDGILRRLEREC